MRQDRNWCWLGMAALACTLLANRGANAQAPSRRPSLGFEPSVSNRTAQAPTSASQPPAFVVVPDVTTNPPALPALPSPTATTAPSSRLAPALPTSARPAPPMPVETTVLPPPSSKAYTARPATPLGPRLTPPPGDAKQALRQGPSRVVVPQAYKTWNLIELAGQSTYYNFNPENLPHEEATSLVEAVDFSTRCDYLADTFHVETNKLWCDFENMYTGRGLLGLGVAVAVAAPIANTSADRRFMDWYRGRVNGPSVRRWSDGFYHLGDHKITVPVLVGVAGVSSLFPENDSAVWLSRWSSRSLRGYIVGAPAVGVLQYGLGASRPNEGPSHWRPFRDNNSVAGHGFIGAVPFLAAASITENRVVRWALVAGSLGTTWSRIDRDAHYLSQAMLGWSIAALSVASIHETETGCRNFFVTPLVFERGMGVGVCFEY